jgi:hypothetical protein
MPVTASSATFDGPPQADGSRMVIERHQCANGVPDVQFVYFAPAGFDPSTVLAGRTAMINAQLADAEATADMSNDGAPVAVEQTMTAFLQAMRAAYKASDKADTCRLAWWLLRRIAAGQIADTQCQAAFGRSAAQWTSFKTNTLTPQSNAWAAVIAATGQ